METAVKEPSNRKTGTDAVPMSERDAYIISRQIERKRLHPSRVVARCNSGFPMVINPEPVDNIESSPVVFTTLYWLTCPLLSRHFHEKESEGIIKELESEISSDNELKQSMGDINTRYAKERVDMIGTRRLNYIYNENKNIGSSLEKTGIGGGAKPERVKCLHAHAAYNIVHEDHPLFELHPELTLDTSACNECSMFGGEN